MAVRLRPSRSRPSLEYHKRNPPGRALATHVDILCQNSQHCGFPLWEHIPIYSLVADLCNIHAIGSHRRLLLLVFVRISYYIGRTSKRLRAFFAPVLVPCAKFYAGYLMSNYDINYTV